MAEESLATETLSYKRSEYNMNPFFDPNLINSSVHRPLSIRLCATDEGHVLQMTRQTYPM